jgi:transglutaminase-like putative cysteine protease
MTAGRWIIDTDVDARTTLGRMAGLVRKALADPRVIHVANVVVMNAAPRDVDAQIREIYEFMISSFAFVPNPLGTQTIRPPGWTTVPGAPGMLQDIETRGITQGACDDAAVLIATLGMANGIPARFRALAFCLSVDGVCDPLEAFTHVLCDLFDGHDWQELDVTRPTDIERPTAAEIARTLVFDVQP